MKKAIAVHEIGLSPTTTVAPGKPFSAPKDEVDKLIKRGHAKPFQEEVEEVIVAAPAEEDVDPFAEADKTKASKSGKSGKSGK